MPSVQPPARPVSARARIWTEIATIDPHTDTWQSQLAGISLTFMDALLAANTTDLEAIADPLRNRIAQLGDDNASAEMRGYLTGLLSLTRHALQRLPSTEELALRHDSQAHRFLMALRGPARARSSRELREILHTGETQISRVGRELIARGLVVQRRGGRVVSWELSPRGHQLTRSFSR
jgi:DNA-binding MarR family transcriptional regulator